LDYVSLSQELKIIIYNYDRMAVVTYKISPVWY